MSVVEVTVVLRFDDDTALTSEEDFRRVLEADWDCEVIGYEEAWFD